MTVGLLQALVHYQAMGDKGFAEFDATVQAYLDFSWKHLNTEEGELLPRAAEALSAADLAAIGAEMTARRDIAPAALPL